MYLKFVKRIDLEYSHRRRRRRRERRRRNKGRKKENGKGMKLRNVLISLVVVNISPDWVIRL